MDIANYYKFNQYKSLIRTLHTPLTRDSMVSEQFLLEKDEKKKLEIYYAPFEYVNESAAVVIGGITPGLHQMERSYSTVIGASHELGDEEILRQVKNNSSFEGTMRKNLVQMLDELGLHEHLGLSSTMNLFNEASHLVHTTSVIPYPVFYKEKNFNGSTPNILKTDILRKYVVECFAKEMSNLENPLIIPLGVNVSKVLHYLVDNQLINSSSLLTGFPHPSGGNGHRVKQFNENKSRMKEMLRSHYQREY